MEFNLKKNQIGILSQALDTVSEQPVDIDFTLPDYCSDIEKILRCKITPKIYNRNLSGGQLQLDGTTVVTILYLDTQGNLRACEQTVPFNSSFQLKSTPENPVIETSTKCEYVNCRALSRRRLTVHGAFSLYARVDCKGFCELYSPESGEGLEFCEKELSVSSLTALCQEQFTAGDELQITNKPPVEVILDSSVSAIVTEQKTIPDKLMFNGELRVRILYSSAEAKQAQQLDCSVPFSRIIDCEGLSEETAVSLCLNVLSYDIRLKSDILADTPVVNVDARLSATVSGYSGEKVNVVLDAFSTECFSDLEKTRVTVPTLTRIFSDTLMQKESVSLDDCAISEIVDFSWEYTQQNPILNSASVSLNSKLNLCILALDENGENVYLERSVEFCSEIQTEQSFNSILEICAAVQSLSYRIADSKTIEIRAELGCNLTLGLSENMVLVSAVSIDEERKIKKRSCALTLYYAEAGENVWDIAKLYNTRLSRIFEENALGCDTLESAVMLMIPTV